MFEGEDPGQGRPDEPLRRPRGRHARRAAPPVGSRRARLLAAAAPIVAWLEPRLTAAGAWLFERRLHVLIVSATVATVAMLGGAVALISFAGGSGPGDQAVGGGDAPRPTSTDPGAPNSYAPILPSPGPTPTPTPSSPPPTPGDGSTDPGDDVPVEPVPTVEPPPDTGNGRPDPPGHTKKPDKP
ncbi:hypothetical protein [Agromyces sp. H66]|uniref:hypothetical protein n=1 Tax=Agromyces sp. H66 TaxID=2529859 RepID=UPI0010AA158A|nr:hypothetical protein [Agromyces sp. H66]